VGAIEVETPPGRRFLIGSGIGEASRRRFARDIAI